MNELILFDGLEFRVKGNLSFSYKCGFGHEKKICFDLNEINYE
jgi:hypothetical protein